MYKLLIALVLVIAIQTPVYSSGLFNYGFGRGVLRKVLGAPFFAVGVVGATAYDVTIIPLKQGVRHYTNAPAIKGW